MVFRQNSKHYSSGGMSLTYFTHASSDENDMIASSYGSSSSHWHRPCLSCVSSDSVDCWFAFHHTLAFLVHFNLQKDRLQSTTYSYARNSNGWSPITIYTMHSMWFVKLSATYLACTFWIKCSAYPYWYWLWSATSVQWRSTSLPVWPITRGNCMLVSETIVKQLFWKLKLISIVCLSLRVHTHTHARTASIVVMLKGIAVPMCRAYLASLVPSCEIGKIYSMTTSMESLAPIGAAPMYTLIYNYTLEKYPGAFNFFSAIIYLYCILLITWVQPESLKCHCKNNQIHLHGLFAHTQIGLSDSKARTANRELSTIH